MNKKIFYKNIECDSDLEYYFAAWLDELKHHGYIISFDKCKEPFILSDDKEHYYYEKKKEKTYQRKETIIRSCSYTPDFWACFSPKGYRKLFTSTEDEKRIGNLFICQAGSHCYKCYFEVKPNVDWNNKTTLFKYLQKWLYQDKNIFVNLVRVPKIFENTFFPEKYKFTVGGKPRKTNKKLNFIDSFLKRLENEPEEY